MGAKFSGLIGYHQTALAKLLSLPNPAQIMKIMVNCILINIILANDKQHSVIYHQLGPKQNISTPISWSADG